MTGSPAYQRFIESTTIDYEKWHDGEGYDLAALADLSQAERSLVRDLMVGRPIAWREIEVLEALADPRGWDAIEAAFESRSIDTKLAAAVALERHGRLRLSIDAVVADTILRLRTIEGGSTRALLLAEQYPTDRVKEALLRASGRKNEIAMHCGALLCYLCGKAREAFDWDLRPLFLRLAPDNNVSDRKAAYRELCALVGMTP
jgi:hypothetical protein